MLKGLDGFNGWNGCGGGVCEGRMDGVMSAWYATALGAILPCCVLLLERGGGRLQKRSAERGRSLGAVEKEQKETEWWV